MSITKLENAQLQDKRTFLRTDFHYFFKTNNPAAIEIIKPTIDLILQKGGSVAIGLTKNSPSDDLVRLAEAVTKIIGRKAEALGGSLLDEETQTRIRNMKSGELLILPDLNQDSFESSASDAALKKFAGLFDVYVNDAVDSSRFNYATIVKLPALLPSFIGIHFYRTAETLKSAVSAPERPFTVILGGVNLAKKIRLIRRLFAIPRLKVDHYCIGGGIAYTFLKSRAVPIGKSLVETALEVDSFQIIEKAQLNESVFQLPVDHLIAENYNDTKGKSVKQNDISVRSMALDIGSKTLSLFEKIVKNSGTVLWYGPLGMTENPAFKTSSVNLAKAIASSKSLSIAIGEDTVKIIQEAGLTGKFDLLCPSSDSALEILHGGILPGFDALGKSGH
jgi:phosphoglycerate kinase